MFEITKLADPNFTYANIVDIHILGNYHCHYVARFAGVVYKKTSNDPEWKWKEFHYSHSERDNGAPPPCFQMSFTAGASTLIANGEKSATASITFTAYLTINVGGYNIESGDPYRTSFTQTFLPIPVP